MSNPPDASEDVENSTPLRRALRRPELLYSALLFIVAAVALGFAIDREGFLPPEHGPAMAVFFVIYGLFTISMGYVHPRVGYVSFDRVAQVAAILVLGPVAAAALNGLASLLFPWHRLAKGRPFLDVLTAALHNAGLMTLIILICGLLYRKLGGDVPLVALEWSDVGLLLILLLSMQALNELGMAVLIALEERRLVNEFSVFAFIVESGAGLGGILVAKALNLMELPVVALVLLVLSLGMLTLTELARIRTRLEAIVEERTRRLTEKTLELELMATRDPLTSLHNRRYADQYLDERVGEYERYRRDFAVALIDLDHFKRINDEHSHQVGDEVLTSIASILAERCRSTDMVARYGGEEFLICFPGASLAAARDACEKIRMALEENDWGTLVQGVGVTLSAGIAVMRPGLDRRSLLSAADRALYEAKSSGRNRIITADAMALTGLPGQR